MFRSIFFILTIFPLTLWAHEGHDHTPGAVIPPKGGVIRTLETIHLEMLPHGKTVKIFIYDKNLKPVETKNYPVSATATKPRSKPEALDLKAEKNYWEYTYDSKGAHRYALQFNIEQGGHKDKIKWNIEPKHKH